MSASDVAIVVLILFIILGLLLVMFCSSEKSSCCSRKCPTIPEQMLFLASGTLTSAQILSLKTSPVILVPAVPGKILTFVAGTIHLLA